MHDFGTLKQVVRSSEMLAPTYQTHHAVSRLQHMSSCSSCPSGVAARNLLTPSTLQSCKDICCCLYGFLIWSRDLLNTKRDYPIGCDVQLVMTAVNSYCLIVVSVLFVCCLIVVPLPPGENPFAVNNNNNNNTVFHETPSTGSDCIHGWWCRKITIRWSPMPQI
jgi:hypothetical protein